VTPTVTSRMTVTYGTIWTPTTDGRYLVETRGVDRASNVETEQSPEEWYLYSHAQSIGMDTATYWADVTAPTTTITSPVSGGYANDAVLYVKGTVDDGSWGVGLGHVQVSTDTGQTWITLPQDAVECADEAGKYTWEYPWETPATSGVYTISARAVNEMGWMGNADAITVSVDTTAPIAQISDPLHGAVISGTQYVVRGSAKTGGGRSINGVGVYVDGSGPNDATLLGSGGRINWVYTWTLPISDGLHQLYAMASDDGPSTQTETLPITVTVDKAAPLVNSDLPAWWSGIITSPTTYVISGTATEMNGTDITAVRVQTDTGQTWQEATIVGRFYPGGDSVVASWQYTWTLGRKDWVTHVVTIRAFDRANNYTDTLYASSVVVDNVACGPSIGGVRMAPDAGTEECFRLARAMTFKNAAAGLAHGGGVLGAVDGHDALCQPVALPVKPDVVGHFRC